MGRYGFLLCQGGGIQLSRGYSLHKSLHELYKEGARVNWLPGKTGIRKLSFRDAGGYMRNHRTDFAAGLSVIGLLIPEAVAYAGIAGLPASSGLVALFFGLACFLAFGSSRYAVVAATSSAAMVLSAGIATLSEVEKGVDPATIAAVLVILTGFWFALARLLGFARAANFVAKPVLRGVSMGLALTITLMQLPKLFGIVPSTHSPWERLVETATGFAGANPASVVTGVVALLVLFLWRSKSQPVGLWVVIGSIVATYVFPLAERGVELVGDISLHGSAISFQSLANADWAGAIQMSAALCIIVYAESYSSIHSAAARNGESIDSNRNLTAIGAANILSGFFGGLPVGAGFSATSLNEASGAQSKVSTAAALAVYLVALVFFLPLISRIPEPVLAAVVIRAVGPGLSPKSLLPYFHWQRDRFLAIASFLAVALLGVVNGLLVSIVLSCVLILMNAAQPRVSELRKLPSSHSFVNVRIFPNAEPIPGILVLRIDQPMFFANAEPVLKKATEMFRARAKEERLSHLILSLEESADLDGTSIEALQVFSKRLEDKGCRPMLCRLHRRARSALVRAAVPALLPGQLSLLSVDRAVKIAKEYQAHEAALSATAMKEDAR